MREEREDNKERERGGGRKREETSHVPNDIQFKRDSRQYNPSQENKMNK